MRCRFAMLLAMVFLIGALLPTQAATAQLDSVLGVSWGASTEQVRQIMAKNNFSFYKETTDVVSGTPILSFKGMYAGYPAYIYVHFIDGQMWQLVASLWEDDIGGLNYPFDDLSKLLSGKYGQSYRNDSYNLPVHSPKQLVPITKYIWSIGGEAKTITLSKRPTFTAGQDKMLGSVSVTYANVELYNALKNKSRQNI
ncbi:MAG: hypothetical protein N2491_10415 [Negativicutes bacterium]|nr:hypothetical protein [Negativicutes bacterium]